MRRIDRVVIAAALVVVGLALFGAAAQPASGVAQAGERNFAGPASMCPGHDWNCVGPESFPVDQVGNENVIVCVGDTDACAGSSQVGDSNKIECVNEQTDVSFAIQTCGPFTQEGDEDAHNEALFKLTFESDVGSTQCVLQTGEIVQDGGTNQFKASFRIVQETTSGHTQTQEAHQVVLAEQENAVDNNQSDVDQVQIQKASGNATKQLQNTGSTACSAMHFPSHADCTDEGLAGPDEPYTCLNLSQDADDEGENISKLFQDVKQEAASKASDAEQQQGAPGGGNDGQIHQSADFDDGKNVDVADQKTEQKLVASEADQSQFEDPHCCGVDSQDGGEDNEESINQSVKQEAGPDALHEASAIGVGVSPTGECKVNQAVEIGEDSAHVSKSQEPCEILAVNTTCVSGEEGGCSTVTDPDAACRDGFFLDEGEGGLACVPSD